jgi:glutamine synthetase
MNTNIIQERVEKDKVKFIQLQFSDIFGVVKSVTIPVQHLSETLKYGTWIDGSSIEGFARIAESDMYLKPDLNTFALIPWLNSPDGNTARFICDIYSPNGEPFEGDPRYILKKVLREAEEMGFEYKTGPEMEFFLFRRENGYIKPLPHDTAGYFDLTTDQAYEVRRDMTIALEQFGINVEASHHEVAQGQHEIDFMYDTALRTADNAITLRFTLKAVAQHHDLHATFMPKPIASINGSGMHVHQSLFDLNANQNAFYDENDKYNLSEKAYQFIAGQLAHIKAMSAILSPTVNSYKRLVPGYEAPVYISWASTNRSALIRVPRYSVGKNEATRIELRCPDPSCNIYLAFAVMLKAGLEGIKQQLTPPPSVEEDVYDLCVEDLLEKNIDTLPGSLAEAVKELKKDTLIQEALGKHTYERYIEAKTKEWNEFRVQVTQWELDKYLEIY